MKKHLLIYLGGALALFVSAPSFAHAYTCGDVVSITDIQTFLCAFSGLISLTTGIVASLALLVFFWGLVKFIAKADDPKEKEAGKNIMIYGVIALFVMFSVFGLVKFLQTSFGVGGTNNANPGAPKIF